MILNRTVLCVGMIFLNYKRQLSMSSFDNTLTLEAKQSKSAVVKNNSKSKYVSVTQKKELKIMYKRIIYCSY